MMKERSWIVRSVMRVIARIEKSMAWEKSGSVFVCVDVEEGKSGCVMSLTYLHRELTGPAIDFTRGARQQWSLSCNCSNTRDRIIQTVQEFCQPVSHVAEHPPR